MIRKPLAERCQQGDQYFRWRGGDVSRLEGFFDAVIALAMTLIVVSSDVPKSFDGLVDSFRRLPAFAACFLLLAMCWYYHFRFHRRFGLENFPIVVLNMLLVFVILIYAYPLKFLFSLLLNPLFGLRGDVGIQRAEIPTLMLVYSSGYSAIFMMFASMHFYAYRQRQELALTPAEVVMTRFGIWEHLGHVAVGAISILLTLINRNLAPLSGLVYCLVGPVQFFIGLRLGPALTTALSTAVEEQVDEAAEEQEA